MTSSPKPASHTLSHPAGGLPKVTLTAPDGARAEIYLHGAHITSWIPAGGSERLFLSQASEFRSGAAIRGGVPVIFPQFAGLGPLVKHGFARLAEWRFVGVDESGGSITARFQLKDSPASLQTWPHAFLAELSVTLGGAQLAVVLDVTNPGGLPLSFTCALHTYLLVDEINSVQIGGLGGVHFRDRAAGDNQGVQSSAGLTFTGEVDRVYAGAASPLVVHTGSRKVIITHAGFPDAVVWNPGAGRCATIPDLKPDDFQQYVCVEGAAVASPVTLEPCRRWHGSQTLVDESVSQE